MAYRFLFLTCIFTSSLLSHFVYSLPEPGRWTFTLTQDEEQFFGVPKSLYKGSTVSITVSCSPDSPEVLDIGWLLRQSPCYEEYLERNLQETFSTYYGCPQLGINPSYTKVRFLKVPEQEYTCKHFDLETTALHFVTQDTTDFSKCEGRHRYYPPKEDKTLQEDARKTKAENIKLDLEPLPVPSSVKGKEEDVSSEKKESPQPRNRREAGTDTKTKTAAKAPGNVTVTTTTTTVKTPTDTKQEKIPDPKMTSDHQIVLDQDGVYLLIIHVILPGGTKNFTAKVDVKMHIDSGYLSAVDWPLLPFYGVMCGLYVIFAVAWLTVSALQWRDLLRIQFWIGGVIFLGLVEKAVFLNEYQSINSTGETGHAGMLFAEVVSCLKRTLARLLVIIVSLGFGIVKPRLGPALHRIVGVGSLYFLLCTVEGCLRVLKPKNDPSNQTIMAEIPLAVLDSAICWWIFSSLVQTTRTLRLRRNVIKLGLYRHFTNTLVFSVLASVVYMTWSLYNHRLTNCLTDWKELWVDEAYWHLLFSLILMVIMVLWRPTNNNQRYAFTPLLDALDDDEEDSVMDKENAALNDVYGTKARNNSGAAAKGQQQGAGALALNSRPKDNKEDENLKWVEDNIPSSLTDTALPSLLDSDEEIMTVRYERNKME